MSRDFSAEEWLSGTVAEDVTVDVAIRTVVADQVGSDIAVAITIIRTAVRVLPMS